MKRTMILLSTFALAFGIACSSDEAEDAASEAAATAKESAGNMMNKMDHAAHEAAESAKAGAGAMAGNAVAACRTMAERGAWDGALEVCKKAHEMMPEDLALEHAYQQALAASKN